MHSIPICKPIMDEEMIEAAADALRNEPLVNGESVFKFEEEFARYIGTKHAVSVSSGTDALILSLLACDVKKGEVITTPFTFIASCNSIVHAGADPVLADIRQEDCNINPSKIKEKINDSTKGILPVHIFGRPCAMDKIMEMAEENDLMVVEDACQAHGAKYDGRKVGGIGHVGCFSFYPTKNMTVGGDGGMVTTDNEEMAAMVRKLRDCGRKERYLHDAIGFTSRLNTVNAAIGRVQLKRLDSWNSSRRRAASLYREELRDLKGIVLPPGDDKAESVHHLFAIRCDDRDGLQKHLSERGIGSAIHYPLTVSRQPAYVDRHLGKFPVSDEASMRTISLPMFPGILDDEVRAVSENITEFFSGH